MRNLIISLFLFSTLIACSKANSKVQYKYKKPGDNGVAARVGDIVVTQEELHKEIQIEVFKKQLELFDIQMNLLNSLLVEKLMKSDPKSKGMTNDQYFEKFIGSKIKITPKDMKEFMNSQGVPSDQQENPRVKERVVQFLTAQKRKEALDSWLAEKTKKSGVEVFFQKPIAPTYDIAVGSAPFAGGEKAKVTIVEFSDFQCPYCAKAAAVINKLKNKYKNKIKVVFKHFPLSFHTHARSTAMASLCANELSPQSFWKFHDEVFLKKHPLGSDHLIKLGVEKLKLDKEKYTQCVNDKKFAAQVEADIQQGKSIGIKGTPSIYVNGELFMDTLSFEKYVEKIDSELAKN